MNRSFKPRGFTLIELMVALTGALFFSIFVFMLTRDASRFFEKEARLAEATLSNINGFRRLSNDVARAGFLASPNIAKDPKRCPTPAVAGSTGTAPATTGWASFPQLQNMGVLRINVGGSATAATGDALAMLTGNGLTPDEIVMYGSYTMNEAFGVRTISSAGVITLETTSGAMRRAGWASLPDAASRAAFMASMFPVGRALRIANQLGEEQYVIIGATAGTMVDATITPDAAGMPVTFQATNPVCGIRGLGADAFVNTVNIIKYSLRDMQADANLAYLYDGFRHPRDVATRLDLVRSELDPKQATDTDITGTVEVVAENVVDLKATLDVVTDIALKTVSTVSTAANIEKYASKASVAPATSLNNGPHLIRGVHLRLSTRSAAPDREASAFGTDVGAGLYRVALTFTGGVGSDYARVRNLESTLAIRNARNSLW